MASSKKYATAADQSAEAVELTRDVVSALAHELGGIASALDLRATAMSALIPKSDLSALRQLVVQIRQVTRGARFARGADAGLMNPNKMQSLREWWSLAERFTAVVLPRGYAVETEFDESSITAEQGAALTWIWLASCKQLAEQGGPPPARVVLRGTRTSNGVAIIAELNTREAELHAAPTRWGRFSSEMATAMGAEPPVWEQQDGTYRWRFDLPG